MLDNPCLTLDNSDSYTDWVADFPNSQCTRTVNNSYGATLVRIGEWIIVAGENRYPTGNSCSPIGRSYTDSQDYLQVCEATSSYYTCPNGGILSGSTCRKIDTEIKLFSSF